MLEVPVSGFCVVSVEVDGVELVALLGDTVLEELADELEPGTTAMPGVTSVVVVLVDCAIGTLGTQPASPRGLALIHADHG